MSDSIFNLGGILIKTNDVGFPQTSRHLEISFPIYRGMKVVIIGASAQ